MALKCPQHTFASLSAAAASVFEMDMNSFLVILWYVEFTSMTTTGPHAHRIQRGKKQGMHGVRQNDTHSRMLS